MRKLVTRAAGAGVVIGVVLAPAAAHAGTGGTAGTGVSHTIPAASAADPDTTMTFTVTVGDLSMSAPASANFESGAPGTSISGPLGQVVVTDNRALLTAAWTATASSTNWVTGSGTGNETIPNSDTTYDPGVVAHTGTITTTPHAITLSTSPQAVVTGSAGVGDNTASWNPTITVAIPAAAVGGAYVATLTQSIS